MATIPPEVMEQMKVLDKSLRREALGYEGKWHGRRRYMDTPTGRSAAIKARLEEFDVATAEQFPLLKSLRESTEKLAELHQRKIELLRELVHVTALKLTIENNIKGGSYACQEHSDPGSETP